MIAKIKKYITVLLAAAVLAVPTLVVAPAYAQGSENIEGPLCNGANLEFNTNAGECQGVEESGERLNDIIKIVINILSVIVGVVAVVMIIFGGLKYITSGGDSSNVSSAKNTIIYAIIGLVIVALAQFIVRFVLDRATTAGE